MPPYPDDTKQQRSDDSRAPCPVCRFVPLAEAPVPPGAEPPCAHCRACGKAIVVALLVPVALWLVGIQFEGRHAPGHPLYATAAPRLCDLALIASLAADAAFGLWLVWYAAGMRFRVLAIAAVQFSLCCLVVWGDLLWSAGPP